MASFRERLEEAMNQSNISAAELSRASGINEGAISQYRKGAYKASQRTLEKLAQTLRVPIPWLMGLDTVEPPLAFVSPVVSDDCVSFPVLGDIAAGYNSIVTENWDGDVIEIPQSQLKGHDPADFFVLRVKGDSMYPLYHDGDKVLILKQDTLGFSGQIGAILYDDENATLKKVEFAAGEDWLRLVPINANYPLKRITGEELNHCHIIGIPRLLIREIDE